MGGLGQRKKQKWAVLAREKTNKLISQLNPSVCGISPLYLERLFHKSKCIILCIDYVHTCIYLRVYV